MKRPPSYQQFRQSLNASHTQGITYGMALLGLAVLLLSSTGTANSAELLVSILAGILLVALGWQYIRMQQLQRQLTQLEGHVRQLTAQKTSGVTLNPQSLSHADPDQYFGGDYTRH